MASICLLPFEVQVRRSLVELLMTAVSSSVTQVIQGMHFLQKHGLVLHFTTPTMNVTARARGGSDDG